ncbi:6-phospho-alpha-glucosidase, partial [Clostridium perfringens]|nr:6-phospho-alpha-glucosidase [Clostridium perfringens]
PVEIEARMAEILETDLSNLEVDYFGLNHFGWCPAVRKNGVDVTKELKEHVSKYGYLSEASYNDALVKDPSWLHTFENSKNIVNLFKDYLPNTYMQYYLLGHDFVKHEDINNTRATQVINGREKRLFEAVDAHERGENVD